jgi:hypothetical protein
MPDVRQLGRHVTNERDAYPQRWLNILTFYQDFGRFPGWSFVDPMVGIVQWILEQPFASDLYPLTSHETLCMSFGFGYSRHRPFISVAPEPSGSVTVTLWAQIGTVVSQETIPLPAARSSIPRFVEALRAFRDPSAP